NTGGPDDRQGAGFSGDNRQRKGPRGNGLAAEKVRVDGLLLLAEPDAEQSDGNQVDNYDQPIDPVESRHFDFGLRISDCGLQISDCKTLKSAIRNPKSALQLHPAIRENCLAR